MKLPIAITFRGISSSQWIEDDIRKRASKLDVFCRDIMSCHVVVERPHRHHVGGNRFSLRIDLTVPGGEIAVTRGSNLHTSRKDLEEGEWLKRFDIDGMRKDLGLVIHEAFDVAGRKLREYAQKRRREIKRHDRVSMAGARRAKRLDRLAS